MHRVLVILCFVTTAFAATTQVVAESAVVEFSANMVRTMTNKKPMESKIYVGKEQVREEMGSGEKQRIRIVSAGKDKMWLLNPARKEYIEATGPAQMKGVPQGRTPSRPPLPGEPGSPCSQQGRGLVCKNLGAEKVNGRTTEKWEFVMSRKKQSWRTLVWVDRTLGVPVREEVPGKFLQELRDIRVGPQPASLFQVPEDYRKIEMPAKGSGTGSEQGRK